MTSPCVHTRAHVLSYRPTTKRSKFYVFYYVFVGMSLNHFLQNYWIFKFD